MPIFDAALQNLASPMVLFFALGFAASALRSDLSIPDQAAKAIALYLMLAIGFKGGAALAGSGLQPAVLAAAAAGIALSFAMPLIAFALLRATSRLNAIDAAAVAAHYGSISIVTFVAASEALRAAGERYDGWIVAVMALMETPAILSGLWLARRAMKSADGEALMPRDAWREVVLNGSVVLLMGAFVIGWITGEKGFTAIAPFIDAPFKGVLCLFLLDMGLVAAARLRGARMLTAPLIAFGFTMPLIGAVLGLATAWALGLNPGTGALFATLAASASYIAVPAAMRLALPEANPAISVTLSLAVTFPFNLIAGIPLYRAAAAAVLG